jgi:hypothetical protein
MAEIQNALSAGKSSSEALWGKSRLGIQHTTIRRHRGIWPAVLFKSSARESLRFAS